MKKDINLSNFEKQQADNQRLVREKTAKKEAESVNEDSYPQQNTTETTQPAAVIPPPEPVYDENNPYVQPQAQEPVQQPVAQPEVQQTAPEDDLIQRLYAMREPEPVIDQAKIDRLQRMGKINGIAQSANLIGDALSLGLGANVRRRQPDRVAPMIYQQYENIMDRNKAEKDAWNVRDFQNNRGNVLFALNQEEKKRHEKLLKENTEASRETAREIRAEATRRWNKEQQDKSEAAKLTAQYRKESLAARTNKTGAKAKETEAKAFDPIEIIDENGTLVKKSQGEWVQNYQDAMKDPEFVKKYLPALKAQFGLTPDAGIRQISREYYDYKIRKAKAEAQSQPQGQTYTPPPAYVSPGTPVKGYVQPQEPVQQTEQPQAQTQIRATDSVPTNQFDAWKQREAEKAIEDAIPPKTASVEDVVNFNKQKEAGLEVLRQKKAEEDAVKKQILIDGIKNAEKALKSDSGYSGTDATINQNHPIVKDVSGKPKSKPQEAPKEVKGVAPNGKIAVFDATTKKFLRYE